MQKPSLVWLLCLCYLTYYVAGVALWDTINESNMPSGCDADHQMREYYKNNREAAREMEDFEMKTRYMIRTNRISKSYVIPVVFHVYGTNFAGQIVDDNKIIKALEKLNEDFHGLNHDYHTVHPLFLANRSTIDITFKLAKKDPNGRPTTGIVYHPVKSGYGNTNRNTEIQADAWNNYKYCNVYIQLDLYGNGGQTSSGVAWYPDTSMSNSNLARVVYNGRYLYGNTDNEFASVLTHEFGHWLNLIHTFEEGCSAASETQCDRTGDKVCDTPQTIGSQGCQVVYNCVGKQVNSENYMDYSGAYGCYKMFTTGQVARMHAALQHPTRFPLWQRDNLIATGLDIGIPVAVSRSVEICSNARWSQNGVTVAGGAWGTTNDKLAYPHGIDVDNEQTVYVTDHHNHRIVAWKRGSTNGQIIAGTGAPNSYGSLLLPTDVIIDKKTDRLIICDSGNRRIIRQSRLNSTDGQILLSNIDCFGLATDNDGFIYISDPIQSVIRRWEPAQTLTTIVAGGNGKGNRLNQLDFPTFIFVDRDQSVYISDGNNGRVVKWMKGATEGIIVAGGRGSADGPAQLSSPRGVVVDQLGNIYVAAYENPGTMLWLKNAISGNVVIGRTISGERTNSLQGPSSIAFDRYGNLYIADQWGCQIQRFDIIQSSCM